MTAFFHAKGYLPDLQVLGVLLDENLSFKWHVQIIRVSENFP